MHTFSNMIISPLSDLSKLAFLTDQETRFLPNSGEPPVGVPYSSSPIGGVWAEDHHPSIDGIV